MRTLEKFLLLAGMGRGLYNRWCMQRIASVAVMVVIASMTAAVLISALALGGIYALYLLFVLKGIDPMGAVLITSIITLFAIAAIITWIRERIVRIKFSMHTPAGDVMDSFLDGLLSR